MSCDACRASLTCSVEPGALRAPPCRAICRDDHQICHAFHVVRFAIYVVCVCHMSWSPARFARHHVVQYVVRFTHLCHAIHVVRASNIAWSPARYARLHVVPYFVHACYLCVKGHTTMSRQMPWHFA